MGSTSDDYGTGIAVDGSGNVVLTGYFGSSTNNFNPGSGKAVTLPFHGTSNQFGSDDIFIVKLAQGTAGSLVLSWARDIGGSGYDAGTGVAFDGSGNVYSTGRFMGTVNFNPNNGKAQSLSGGGIFVSKLDPNGNYLAAASMAGTADGNGTGSGNAMALDGTGNVYTTGVFDRTADFDPTSGTYNLTANGSSDVFVSVLTQTNTPGAMPPGGQDLGTPPLAAGAGSVTLSPTVQTIAPPATADRAAPDQIDWLLAAAARKRSSLYADWLAN